MSHYTRPHRKLYSGRDWFAHHAMPIDEVSEKQLTCDITGRLIKRCSTTTSPDPFEVKEEREKELQVQEAQETVLREAKKLIRKILTARQREAFQLWVKGLKYSHVGQKLGISRQAAKKLIEAAASRLAIQFERNPKLREARDRWLLLLQH